MKPPPFTPLGCATPIGGASGMPGICIGSIGMPLMCGGMGCGGPGGGTPCAAICVRSSASSCRLS